MKRAILAAILLIVLNIGMPHRALAEGAAPELKSMGLATALGLDPIPGDALFYAGKPVQGTVSLLLGGAGAGLFYYFGVWRAITWRSGADSGLMAIGALLYFPTLVWDGLVGISEVKRHNDRVRKFMDTYRPSVSMTPEGIHVAAEIRF
jgi:hypothetical protein